MMDGSRPWLDELHRVAVYACGVSAAEVTTLRNQPIHGGSPTATRTTHDAGGARNDLDTPTDYRPRRPSRTSNGYANQRTVLGGCGVPAGNLVANGDFAAEHDRLELAAATAAPRCVQRRGGPCGQAAQVAIGAAGRNTSAS